ncbi:unnamed protein product, partial [Musa hybrid cultivar]
MAFANRIVNLLKKSITSSPSLYQAIRCMSSSKIFIGGLSNGTDDQSLREAFTNYGEVVEARVIMDRETGRSRSFGFVTFTSNEDASAAIYGMDGKDLHGRMIRVNYATERTGGFRGGFGGGSYGGGGYGGGGSGYGNMGGSYSGSSGGGYGGEDMEMAAQIIMGEATIQAPLLAMMVMVVGMIMLVLVVVMELPLVVVVAVMVAATVVLLQKKVAAMLIMVVVPMVVVNPQASAAASATMVDMVTTT